MQGLEGTRQGDRGTEEGLKYLSCEERVRELEETILERLAQGDLKHLYKWHMGENEKRAR